MKPLRIWRSTIRIPLLVSTKPNICFAFSGECPLGHVKNEQTGECDDIDECESSDVSCNIETQVCYNTKGSYKCLDILPAETTACPNGFQFDNKINQCIDINECEDKIAKCASNKECVNIPGGYECVDQKKTTPKYDLSVVIIFKFEAQL